VEEKMNDKGAPRKTLGISDRIILKMDFRKIGWCDMNWIHLAQDRD
jgi:hypothetical protein